jgi:carboxyl-terminal processing protease
MPRWNLAWLVGIVGVTLVGLAVSRSAPLRDKDKDYELVHLIVDVLDEVDHNYVRELDADAKRKLVEDMINGGLMRLDEHSSYINPRNYKRFNKETKAKFTGVGIQLNTDANGLLTVHSPLVGTPAYEAGILAGDIIVKIDGKSTETMTQDEAIDLIQGEIGKVVNLTVLHEGTKETVDIPITRAEIKVQSVLGDVRLPDNSWDYMIDKDNKIAYVRLTGFYETTAKELGQALTELKKEGIHGLILDLRMNGGGLLRSAVEISRMFLPEGRIVSTRGRDKEEEAYDADGRGAILVPPKDFPMVILINKYSASASEIVAAALQDHERAVIIGERSYGKGSVQNVTKLEGGKSALKLTTASYWRPSGKNIHRFFDSKEKDDWGVKPNPGFDVPMKAEERLAFMMNRRDRDVVHGKEGEKQASASKTELVKKEGETKKDGEKEKKPFEDRVMKKALEYLRGEIKKVEAGG